MAHRSLSYSFLERILLHPTRFSIFKTPRILPASSQTTKACFTDTAHRSANAYRAATPVTTVNTRLPKEMTDALDEKIGALRAHLVDTDGKLQEPQSMRALYTQIDRTTHHIRKVGDGPDGIPVVKIVSREALVEIVRNREAMANKKDVAELAKQVELNWAVSENDLAHRLKKIQEFLQDGKRLEILIAPKRKGRRAMPEECQDLMARIKETVAGVEGVEEWKAQQGTLGKTVELSYKGREEGTAEYRERAKGEKSEKMEKKAAEREERRAKEEARQRRKDEETKHKEREKARLGIPNA